MFFSDLTGRGRVIALLALLCMFLAGVWAFSASLNLAVAPVGLHAVVPPAGGQAPPVPPGSVLKSKIVIPRSGEGPSATFLIGGDLMFARAVSAKYSPKNLATVVDGLGSIFNDVDAGIANLEGPISEVVPPKGDPHTMVFNFPPTTIDALKALGVKGVSLANNHSENAGQKGLATTRTLLSKAGIVAIGGPRDKDTVSVGTFPGRELTIVVIGVHTLLTHPDISALIRSYKKDPKNRVIVMPHWGAEYKAVHGPGQEKDAHAWIDAGADLVVGAHPHVIQDMEVYKDVPIVYSLGNLVFDQNFSRATQEGLLVGGEFREDGLTLRAYPVALKTYKPSLMEGVRRDQILKTLLAFVKQYVQEGAAGNVLEFPR